MWTVLRLEPEKILGIRQTEPAVKHKPDIIISFNKCAAEGEVTAIVPGVEV